MKNGIIAMNKLHFFILTACVFLALTTSSAQTSRFKQYSLKYGITIEIPQHWTIIDKQVMDQIDSNTELLTQVPQGDNDIIIAANYIVNDQILATVRVSVRTRNTFSQEDIKNLSQPEIDNQDILSRAALVNGLEQMNDKLTKVSEFKTTKEMLDGFICTHTKYQTTYPYKILNNSLYVFYLGDRSVKMMLAYETGQASILKLTIEKIKNSLTITR